MPITINNRYILHESLGQGAMGIVFRATDRLSGETVAIKRVTIAGEDLQFSTRSDGLTTEGIKLALAQEFQTLASLRHPNIISVIDYGFDEHRQPYFTMNYLPKSQTIIQASQNCDENAKAAFLIQTLQALVYLHRRNILHRDLKPGNVLVTDGRVRVLDFGLSVSREQARGRSGTLAYMAPEIIQSGQADETSDLYAIGVMAYQMFAGQLPFEALDIMSILTKPIDLEMLDASPKIAAIIEKLLQKSPQDRFASAHETILALNNTIDSPLPEEDVAIRESFLQAAEFVGRDAELSRLLQSLDLAAHGQGSTWLVGGESGVGKTRLINELRTHALVRGATVLRGQAVEDAGRPHQLWQEPLRRMALFGQMDELQAAVLQPIIPDIEKLLDRNIPPAPLLDDNEAAQRLALTMGEVIKNSALATGLLVLILEDLHWGRESLEVLGVINRMAGDIPLIVIGTYRIEDAPTLPVQLPLMQKLLLSRFGEKGISALSASMLGNLGTQPQILNLLQEETEGNVFFLVETVRVLAEEAGSLQEVNSKMLPQAVFAGGVQRILQRRLGKVTEPYRPLLKIAAIAGRELDLKVLQLLGPDIRLEDWLTSCANVPVLEIQEDQWRFAHDKLREALLADLDISESQEIHLQVAKAIELTYANDLSTHYGRLAWHYAETENHWKEMQFAKLAAETAAAQYSHEEALRFYQQALTRTAQHDLSNRFEILLGQEAIYKLQGQSEKRLEALEALQRTAIEINDHAKEARVSLCWVDYYYDRGNFPAAIETAKQTLELAANHQAEISVKAYNFLATSYWKQNNLEEAASYSETGLGFARQVGDQKNEAELLNDLGLIAFEKRALAEAQVRFEESLSLASELGYARIEANSLNNLGMVAGYQGKIQDAQSYYEQALKIAEETGARKQKAMNLANLGWISGLLGNYEEAIRYTEENIRIAREIGDPYNETFGLINLSSYAGAVGDQDAALKAAEQARELAQQIHNLSAEGWALTNLGHCYFADSQPKQAELAYQAALEIRKELQQPLLATEPQAGLVRVSLAQGDLETAFQITCEILPVIEENQNLAGTDDPIRVYLACYLALNAKHDPQADPILKAAHDLIQSRAANIPDLEKRQSYLENIPHHHEITLAWQQNQKKDIF